MNEYYLKWLDKPIPALDNKTPREAVKSKKGREKVLDLLKTIENMEARKVKDTGRPFLINIERLWKELGLKR